MLRVTLRGLRARGLRLLLSALAVVLGTAFVSGAFVLTDTLQQVFDDLFVTAASGTDVVVRPLDTAVDGSGDPSGADLTLPLSLVADVADVPGVAVADPSVFFFAGLLRPGGAVYETTGAPLFGQNYPADESLSPYEVREGRAPQADDEVAVDAGTAAATRYDLGDTVPVFTTGEAEDFTLVGIVGFGEADSPAGAGVLLFDTDRALTLSGEPDRVGQIGVAAEPGGDVAALRQSVADVLPDGAEAVTADQQAADDAAAVGEGLAFFTTFLLAFAGVALLVGSFLIFNTFTMLVAQRVRELALLRAVGAGRRQVVGSVLVESAVVGLLAGGIGVLGGIGVAFGLRALIESFGGTLPDGPLVVAPRTIVVSLVVGVGVTVAASLVPAVRASRIPPVAALRESALPESSGRVSTVLGGLLLLGGAVALGLGVGDDLTLVGVGAVGVFFGIVLLARRLVPVAVTLLRPVATTRLASGLLGLLAVLSALAVLAGWVVITLQGVLLVLTGLVLVPLALLLLVAGGGALRDVVAYEGPVPARIGARNTVRSAGRTATTAVALMIGVALVCAVSVVAASVRASTESVLDESFAADVAVTEAGFAEQGLDEGLLRALRDAPDVSRVDVVPFGDVQVAAGDGPAQTVEVSALPPGAFGVTLDVALASGDVADLRPGEVLLDVPTATGLGVGLGDRVTLSPEAGGGPTRDLAVAGTYESNPLAEAGLVATQDADGVLDVPVQFVLVAGDGDQAATREAVEDVVAGYPSAEVQSREDFIGQIGTVLDQLLLFINALLGLSVLVAFFGIVNTLALSVIERTRELGVLRAVGLSRTQLERMVRVEALVIGLFGGVLGVALGTLLGVVLQRALVDRGFTVLQIPVTTLVAAVVVSALAGVVAAVVPAQRAARMDVLEAVRTE